VDTEFTGTSANGLGDFSSQFRVLVQSMNPAWTRTPVAKLATEIAFDQKKKADR
jgi:hypothetical protein